MEWKGQSAVTEVTVCSSHGWNVRSMLGQSQRYGWEMSRAGDGGPGGCPAGLALPCHA